MVEVIQILLDETVIVLGLGYCDRVIILIVIPIPMSSETYPVSIEKHYFQELGASINQQTAAMRQPLKIQYTDMPNLHLYVKTILKTLPEFQPSYQSSATKSNPIKWKESVYYGQMRNGIPEGEGVLIKADGTYMHGSFKGGISNGKFRIIKPSKQYVFEGNVLNDMPEGEGEYKSEFHHFKGKFAIGQPTGEGQESYNNGEWVFKGIYQMGIKKNGLLKWGKTGQNQYSNYYEGPLDKEGKYDGIGTLKTKDGIYKGQFKNGMKEGKGEFIYLNGCRYQGTYKRNQKSGAGTLYNGNKTKWYEGGWHKDFPHGQGQFFTNGVSSGVTDVVYGVKKDELQESK